MSLFVIAGFKTCLPKNHGNDGSSNKRFIIVKKRDESEERDNFASQMSAVWKSDVSVGFS